MKRSSFTYGQIDKVLRSLGFTCRIDKDAPPARIYELKDPKWIIILPAFPLTDRALEYHLAAVRTDLDLNGLAEPSVFDAELQKVG